MTPCSQVKLWAALVFDRRSLTARDMSICFLRKGKTAFIINFLEFFYSVLYMLLLKCQENELQDLRFVCVSQMNLLTACALACV